MFKYFKSCLIYLPVFFFEKTVVHRKMRKMKHLFFFLCVITVPPTYGKVINQDVNYLLTLQVSVRLLQINVIYRGLSNQQLSALLESALGCIILSISAAVYSDCVSLPFGLVHLVKQSHSNLGAHQTAPLRPPKSWFFF